MPCLGGGGGIDKLPLRKYSFQQSFHYPSMLVIILHYPFSSPQPLLHKSCIKCDLLKCFSESLKASPRSLSSQHQTVFLELCISSFSPTHLDVVSYPTFRNGNIIRILHVTYIMFRNIGDCMAIPLSIAYFIDSSECSL